MLIALCTSQPVSRDSGSYLAELKTKPSLLLLSLAFSPLFSPSLSFHFSFSLSRLSLILIYPEGIH